MSVVVALTCPVCGGPVSNSSEQCEFCGSYIFIKSDLPKLSPANLNRKVIQDQIKELRARFRSNTFDEEAKYGLGVAYYSLGLLSDAARELTEASILMPENPHIHSQLAVVMRDQFREGDESILPAMRERINTALKLDPDHVESLSLLYSLEVSDGQTAMAKRTLDRLESISPKKAREVRVELLKRRSQSRLNKFQWLEAKPEILELADLDEPSATKVLKSYIEGIRLNFPVVFVSTMLANIASFRHLIFYGGSLFPLLFFYSASTLQMHERLIGSCITIGLAIYSVKFTERRVLEDPGLFKEQDVSDPASPSVLISLADYIDASRNGNLVRLEVGFLISPSSTQARSNPDMQSESTSL